MNVFLSYVRCRAMVEMMLYNILSYYENSNTLNLWIIHILRLK